MFKSSISSHKFYHTNIVINHFHYPLLANRSIAESSTLSVVELVRHDLLDFLGEALLQGLGDLGVAGGV